jgi:NADPH:quinone reductase-like Zn-dependent oxidoreductase
MKALIFCEIGEPKSVLKLAEIPTPPLAAGEALVRVVLSPISPSDLHMVRGAMAISRNCQPAQVLRAWGLSRLWVRACKV